MNIKNILLLVGLILLFALLALYMMAPFLMSLWTPTSTQQDVTDSQEFPAPKLVTDIQALTGTVRNVTHEGFSLELVDFPPARDNESLAHRLVRVASSTQFERRGAPGDQIAHEVAMERWMKEFNSLLSTLQSSSKAQISPDHPQLQEFLRNNPQPSIYSVDVIGHKDLVEGSTVAVMANKNIFDALEFDAVTVIVLSQ